MYEILQLIVCITHTHVMKYIQMIGLYCDISISILFTLVELNKLMN